jgi:hypothetical protein
LNETPIRSSTPFWPVQIGEDTRRSILVLIEAGRGNLDGLVAFSDTIAQRSGQSNLMIGEIALQVRDVLTIVGEADVSVGTDEVRRILAKAGSSHRCLERVRVDRQVPCAAGRSQFRRCLTVDVDLPVA